MRLRLARFEGLRIELAPGWYELPSHLPDDERTRLIDLLAQSVPGVADVVECTWAELDRVRPSGASLIHVAVPESVTTQERVARLDGLAVRLGLYTYDAAERWPERAWDELEVKSALATWLRRSLARPEHPLAGLGIAQLPVTLLSGSTSEPIELLELVEETVALAAEQGADAIDWRRCAELSIARRVRRRLEPMRGVLWPEVARCLGEAPDGVIGADLGASALAELGRVGLIQRFEGDAVLVAIARAVARLGLAAHIFGRDKLQRLRLLTRKLRATTVDEALVVFDPDLEVVPGDPWWVDLRQLREFDAFAADFKARLLADEHAHVIVVHRGGDGTLTLLRGLFEELEAAGTVVIGAKKTDRFTRFAPQSWLLAMAEELTIWCETQSVEASRIDRTLFYSSLDKDSLMMILHDLVGIAGRELASRGQRLCLAFPPTDLFSRVQRLLSTHAEQLASLNCDVVCTFEGSFEPSTSFAVMTGPRLNVLDSAGEVRPDVQSAVRQLLEARADLPALFDDVDESVERFAGMLRHGPRGVLASVREACRAAQRRDKVRSADIDIAFERLLGGHE